MTLFDAPAGGDAPRAPVQRCRLLVAYDGTGLHGYARQRDVRTVEGELADALARVAGGPVANLACAGRTDAGVHAWGQVVSFDVDREVDLRRVRDALNGLLGPEIVVRAAVPAAPDFDARHSAQWRRYRYTIVNRPAPDPFLARYAWWVGAPLDVHAAPPRRRPLRRRARFRRILPSGSGRVGFDTTSVRVALERPR